MHNICPATDSSLFLRSLSTILLRAYRDHFYHPGLLARILGFRKEPLRAV